MSGRLLVLAVVASFMGSAMMCAGCEDSAATEKNVSQQLAEPEARRTCACRDILRWLIRSTMANGAADSARTLELVRSVSPPVGGIIGACFGSYE